MLLENETEVGPLTIEGANATGEQHRQRAVLLAWTAELNS